MTEDEDQRAEALSKLNREWLPFADLVFDDENEEPPIPVYGLRIVMWADASGAEFYAFSQAGDPELDVSVALLERTKFQMQMNAMFHPLVEEVSPDLYDQDQDKGSQGDEDEEDDE